jgi:hypothetical protein
LHGHLAGDGGRGSHQSGKLGRFGGIVGPKAGVVGEHDGKDREKTGYEKKKQLFLLQQLWDPEKMQKNISFGPCSVEVPY